MQTVIKRKNEEELNEIRKQSPIDSFRYAWKSSEGSIQYPKRLKILFDFLDLSGTLEEQAAENTWTNQDRILNAYTIEFWSSLIFTRKELDVSNLLQALSSLARYTQQRFHP